MMLHVLYSIPVPIHVGGAGNWTTDGCVTYVHQSNHAASIIECQCLHLTNFAILVVRLQAIQRKRRTIALSTHRTYQVGSSPTYL